MPKFTLEHQSSSPQPEAFSTLKNFLKEDTEFRRFDPKMELSFDESQNRLFIKSSQFKAEIHVKDLTSQGSHITVIVDLPLLLAPFKSKVQETLQRKLKKYLA